MGGCVWCVGVVWCVSLRAHAYAMRQIAGKVFGSKIGLFIHRLDVSLRVKAFATEGRPVPSWFTVGPCFAGVQCFRLLLLLPFRLLLLLLLIIYCNTRTLTSLFIKKMYTVIRVHASDQVGEQSASYQIC